MPKPSQKKSLVLNKLKTGIGFQDPFPTVVLFEWISFRPAREVLDGRSPKRGHCFVSSRLELSKCRDWMIRREGIGNKNHHFFHWLCSTVQLSPHPLVPFVGKGAPAEPMTAELETFGTEKQNKRRKGQSC